MHENEIVTQIIDKALKVHRNLGPGLLESTYQECLSYELLQAGLIVDKQKEVPLIYETVKLQCGYRMDLLVEKKVIVEIKSVEALNDLHLAQVLTYLKLSHCRLGLLINFNVALLKQGLKRVANQL